MARTAKSEQTKNPVLQSDISQLNVPRTDVPRTDVPPLAPRVFDFREAFELTAAERQSIAADAVLRMNAELELAVQVALGAVPRIDALRPMLARMPIDLEQIDNIDTYARAASYAQSRYEAAVAPPEKLEEVYQAAIERRALLRSDLDNLINHRIVPRELLGRLNNEVGYVNVGNDLKTIATVLQNTPEAQGRMVVQPAELEADLKLAYELLELDARRNPSRTAPPDVVDDRSRAFTLLWTAYDQAIRHITWLRWEEEDAAQIVPSLYATSGRPRKVKDAQARANAGDAGGQSASNPSGASLGSDSSSNAQNVGQPPVAPGVRGGDPFGANG